MRVPYCHITKPATAVGRSITAPEERTPAPVYEFVKGPHTSKAALGTTTDTEHPSPSLDDISPGQPVQHAPGPGPHADTATPEQGDGIHTTLECEIPADIREDEQFAHEENTEHAFFATEDHESADGQATPISSMNRNALIGECKARGIKFGYNDRKVDLIEKIHAYTTQE